jgi:hypothetical protein
VGMRYNLATDGGLRGRRGALATEQPDQACGLTMPLTKRYGRIAADLATWLDIAHHAAFVGDPRARADREMVTDGGLSTHHDAVA